MGLVAEVVFDRDFPEFVFDDDPPFSIVSQDDLRLLRFHV